jgi:hypothetical protein
MKWRFGLALATSALAGALFGVFVGPGLAADVRVQRCGVDGVVDVVFDVVDSSEVWQYLPAMKRAPELEEFSGRASVVVYAGTVQGLVHGRVGVSPKEFSGVVCVLLDDRPIIYTNVSRAGYTRP